MKTHEFRLLVETTDTRKAALFKVLSAFAQRKPDGCEFGLKNISPRQDAATERAAIKRKVNKLRPKYVGSFYAGRALNEVIDFLITRTKRTADRKGGLGRE